MHETATAPAGGVHHVQTASKDDSANSIMSLDVLPSKDRFQLT